MVTRKAITRRIMQCTPGELQHVLNIVHSWVEDFGDEMAGEVETVQEIIDLLSRPEYIQEAEECEIQTGENYFKIVFGI